MTFSLRRALGRALVAVAASATALAAQGAPAAPPAPPAVSVGGVVYAQYVYMLKDTANHLNDFDVTRGYLNVIGKFSGGVQTRVTVDINHVAAGSQAYRLKYAFAGWTPKNSPVTYKFGLFTTPWIDWEEALWDYRMQGPTILDRNGYLTSSDFGFGADGNVNKEQVDFQVGIFDNGSYSAGIGDQRKDLEGRLSVRVTPTDDASRVGGLRVTAYGQYGKPTTGGTRSRGVGMVSYKSKAVTLVALGALMTDSTTGGAHLSSQAFGGYGVYHIQKSNAALIARVDYVKPNKNAASTVAGYSNTRIIAGVSYQLTPNVRLLGDWDNLSYRNGSPTPAAEAARSQLLFQTQFTF